MKRLVSLPAAHQNRGQRRIQSGGLSVKKYATILLGAILACLFGAASAAQDFAIPAIEAPQGGNELLHSMALSDTAYLLSASKNLYILDVQTGEAQRLSLRSAGLQYEQVPQTALDFYDLPDEKAVPEWLQKSASLVDLLIAEGETLYGLNELSGALYRVEISGKEATLCPLTMLDFFSGAEGDWMPAISTGAACDGTLFLLMCLAAEESQPALYRFDMDSGVREMVRGPGAVAEITRYRDGRRLLLEKDDDSQWQILIFDPSTGDQHVLFESNRLKLGDARGLVYDAWRDRVLICCGNELLHLVSETVCEAVAFLPPLLPSCQAITRDGTLVLMDDAAVYGISALQMVSRPLEIACSQMESWMEQGFSQAYPNFPVRHRQVYEHEAMALFAETIAIQSDEIDIFELPIGMASQSAIEKGYYVPLTQSQNIRETTDGYWPFFRQTVIHQGEIAAVLGKTEQYTLGYSRYALDRLGLTASDMPTGFSELMDFLLAWDERTGELSQWEGITPFGIENSQLKAELFAFLLDQYFLLMQQDLPAAMLCEAELARLLDQLSEVCATIPESGASIQTNEPFVRFARFQVNDRPSYLFSRYCSFLPGRRSFANGASVSDFVPMALALPSQDRPIVLLEGTLFVVNPYSSQKERAVQWLAYYISHRPAKDAATFERDAAPSEFETYKAMKKAYTEELERMEIRLKAAEGAAKSDLEAQIQTTRERLQAIEQIKWEVSEEALAEYAQVLEKCTLFWNDLYTSSGSFGKTYLRNYHPYSLLRHIAAAGLSSPPGYTVLDL